MEVRRLAWAGLEVNAGGETAVVDFVEDFSWLPEEPPGGQIPPSPAPGRAIAALLTHLHWDHADVGALSRVLAPDGVVLRPERGSGYPAEVALIDKPESELRESGLRTEVLDPWESTEVGPFAIAALPAADGFGDPQVSWCVEADGCRILHAGDTLFHGWWWRSALRHGPFDAVFLPVGGAVVDLPSRQPPSPLPAGMDPRQAAVAAHLLGARMVVPIHYGPLHEAPNYVQSENAPDSLREAAAAAPVEVRVLEPGERIRIGRD
ncbi:MAG TPA: MBL fold metallo-hydrolase [Solirubrobacterales bacterium]|nr:MBL fold metallo-hydrolase [Solirubrobacterales bacterium]